MAIVAQGKRGRVYFEPTALHEAAALEAECTWKPDLEICHWPGRTNVVEYGLTTFGDLFTSRQLVTLTTISDLVLEAREHVKEDALALQLQDDSKGIADGGRGATAYADALAVLMAFCLDKLADYDNTICTWNPTNQNIGHLFTKQAIPMAWDFPEASPIAAGLSFDTIAEGIAKAVELLPAEGTGVAFLEDCARLATDTPSVFSTDPPYYDNIEYADLSDFFYVWLRRTLGTVLPELLSTMAVPKSAELVANPYRHNGREDAEAFFLDGMTRSMKRLAEQGHPSFPVTIYYAFKQSETKKGSTASTGWETFLDATIRAGFSLTGTWPMRTEREARSIGRGSNALASSIILVCRPRAEDAPTTSRRGFIQALKAELSQALAHLQKSNIAPVDLAQAAIGPGMAVYTRYSRVLESDGSLLSVRTALALINQVLDETLAEQEGDFDADSRWALAWFEQSGFAEGDYGVAETLSKAKNTSVQGLVDAGVLASKGGKVRLLSPGDLPEDWDPATDSRLTVWEMVHHLVRVLESGGEGAAAELAGKLDSQAEAARELAYRLYSICERKKRAPEALSYNALVQSWPEITRLAREGARPRTEQADLFGKREN